MTTRLVVLADTHLPRKRRVLPTEVLTELVQTDLIVHLGDFTEVEVAEQLEAYAPLVAVSGNNDSAEVKNRFPTRRLLELEGKTLVLLHGDIGGRTAQQAALAEQGGDAVLFGHSHLPLSQVVGGRLLFNPGSPTDRRWGPHRSFGLMDVGESIEARVVLLD